MVEQIVDQNKKPIQNGWLGLDRAFTSKNFKEAGISRPLKNFNTTKMKVFREKSTTKITSALRIF